MIKLSLKRVEEKSPPRKGLSGNIQCMKSLPECGAAAAGSIPHPQCEHALLSTALNLQVAAARVCVFYL